jgi:predicted RecA/RadA family phage recombinase
LENVYRISATAPITSLDSGDLYFDTSTNILNVYGASGWQNAGSSVNGTSQRYNYTATNAQTTFTGADNNGNTLTYDAGYIDVYLNGVKLLNGTDVTVSSGTSVVLATGATAGDVVDIVAYGTFSVASLNADNLDSGTVPSARISGAYTGITQTGTLASFASTGIDDNATSTAITIDSSGNVGIGTTAPVNYYADNLVINAQSEGGITLIGTSAHENYLAWADGTSGTERYSGYLSYNHSSNFMRFATNGGSERMRITSTGNVGIGTASPSQALDVNGLGVVLAINSTNSNLYKIVFKDNGVNRGYIGCGSTAVFAFADASASELMRIDSSGNVLVGTTSITAGVTSSSGKGISLRSEGYIFASIPNDSPLIINRQTSDGYIAQFRKDGITVGSISAIDGDLTIQSTTSGHEGLRFGNGAIVPVNTTGASTDIECTLGGATSRFNNLYLGGGLYVGGTGTANKLDDYEEGTWTPTYVPASGAFTSVTYASTSGNYTKIGNTVYFTFYIQTNAITVGSASGVIAIGGLPFAPSATGVPKGGGTVTNAANFAGDKPSYGTASVSSQINLFYSTGSTSNDISLNVSDLGTGGTDNVFQMFGTYLTTA